MRSEPPSSHGPLRACPVAPFLAALSLVSGVLWAWPAEAQRYVAARQPEAWQGSGAGPASQAGQGVIEDRPGGEAEGDFDGETNQGLAPRGSCGDCSGPWVCGGSRRGRDETFLFGPDGTPFPNGLWVRGEYLLWWSKSGEAPPLVTTSPAGTPQPQAGVLGEPGTAVLFGENLSFGTSSGGRFTIGSWLTPCELSALEGTYFFLGRQAARFDRSSEGDPILARPFLNVETGLQDALQIALPGIMSGSVSVSAGTELQSADLVLRRVVARCPNTRLDVLVGYRFGWLGEDLTVNSSSTSIDPEGIVPVGTVVQVHDAFDTRSEFHGAEFGLAAQSRSCGWSLELLLKLALGNTHSAVTINGSTTTSVPNEAPITSTGGFLALPTNTGRFERNDFTVIPELGLTLAYEMTPRMRATFGYSLFYWSKVARAGDQVDFNLNPSQFPPGQITGAPQPEFRFVTNDFWAQGLSFGIDCRF